LLIVTAGALRTQLGSVLGAILTKLDSQVLPWLLVLLKDIHLRLFIPTFLYFNGPKMLEK
jgi:hypothetical protein